MAYKPKYARGNAPDPGQRPGVYPVKPSRSRGKLVLFVLLGILIIPASCFGSFLMLRQMALSLGQPKAAQVEKTADAAIVASLDGEVAEKMDAARALLTSERRPQSQTPEETVPQLEPVRKIYWIEDDVQVAPEPDQSLFGATADPGALEQLLLDAAWLLDGQQTYFDPHGQRYGDGEVDYYLDDSIFAVTWQEVHDGSVYTFSEVKVAHPSQFRRHLAGGEYGSDMQFVPTEMAAAVNAVVASAGDFYRFRDFGAVVYQGEAKRVEGTYAETCYIDKNGDMHFTYGGEVLTTEAVQAYVDEHDIWFSLAFGPVLVDNYEPVEHSWYGVGEILEGYARAALCQMGELHYIVVAANTTGIHQEIPTVAMFSKNIQATGCRMAYCLDGGQTATIVMNDNLMNRPVYGQQRKISDIIYFATAVPNGGEDNG